MPDHILHVSITTYDYAKVAWQISQKYGSGAEDHAIVLHEGLPDYKSPFSHEINFLVARNLNYYDLMREFNFPFAIDDEGLAPLLPYVRQSYHMLCRRVGTDSNFIRLERKWLLGIQFWKAYLTHYNITRVIFVNSPHEGFDFLIYQLCMAMNIPTAVFQISLSSSRCYIVEKLGAPIDLFLRRYAQLQENPPETMDLAPDYAKVYQRMTTPNTDRTPAWGAKSHVKKLIYTRHTNRYADYWYKLCANLKERKRPSLRTLVMGPFYKFTQLDFRLTGGFFANMIMARIHPIVKKDQILHKAYLQRSTAPDYSKKYIYFPLHYQPESTSNPQGGGCYYEQAIPIRILSQSLPDDVYIYVKEHPAQSYGFRDVDFYDELLSIPKVVLVSPETDTYKLLEHCVAVSTLIGTAGWEGLFAGKPFIMFGFWLTMHFPGVFHVRTLEECTGAVKSILSGNFKVTHEDLKLALLAASQTEAWNPFYPDCAGSEEIVSSLIEMFDKFMEIQEEKKCQNNGKISD